MWKPTFDFISLHYLYILGCSLLAFLIIFAGGNVAAVDAFFFGMSGCTESGLNTVDVKALHVWQQLVIYFFPIVTNFAFINIAVVIVRLLWFEKRLKEIAPDFLRHKAQQDAEAQSPANSSTKSGLTSSASSPLNAQISAPTAAEPLRKPVEHKSEKSDHVAWADEKAVGEQPEMSREKQPVDVEEDDHISIASAEPTMRNRSGIALNRIASEMFVLGDTPAKRSLKMEPTRTLSFGGLGVPPPAPAFLSENVTVERNSNFKGLTAEDKEKLGGVEYRSLRLLLKFVVAYFFGLHLFGALCLAPWAAAAPQKYRDYLAEDDQNRIWWAFYTSQTMISNLGFTLSPLSMIQFRDSTWVMLVTTFLAFAGNTCYPIFLRLAIWTASKIMPKTSSSQQSLRFLLDHPRRCYTLLFPGRVTWILFSILFVLNFIDTLLIIVLDLDNEAVNALAPGPRVLAALFQSASSRHTGTSSFALAKVSSAVQFSLLVMMYIANEFCMFWCPRMSLIVLITVFPISVAIRASNTYEEQALGRYEAVVDPDDDQAPRTYLINHMRNQLSFDLWYIFIGIFCICISEASRLADPEETAFNVFAIFFEVVSGYANVGLSLGTMSTDTSLSGDFKIFSKLVMCAMMYRGRHRGLPYALDRAIVLPTEDFGHLENKDDGETSAYELKKKQFARFKTI